MNPKLIFPLRAVLILLALGLLLAQVLTPFVATEVGIENPEVRHLVIPYSVVGVLTLAAVQFSLVMIWRLLSMVGRGDIFTSRALPWVDAIASSIAVAAFLPCCVMVHLLFFVGVGGPGVVLGLGACMFGGIALCLLIVVMRALLTTATANRNELDEVI